MHILHSDPLIAAGLAATLKKLRDFEVGGCSVDSTVRYSTERHFTRRDIVAADYGSGLWLTASKGPCEDRILILTHCDSEAEICHALEQGARGYLLPGCSLKDLLDGLQRSRRRAARGNSVERARAARQDFGQVRT